MSTIKSFEEIGAWQDARKLCSLIYGYCQRNSFSKDYKLKEQINGSSGSIMDNIAEGFERGGNKEFINFLRYAKVSCGETRSQLCRSVDRQHISIAEFEEAIMLTKVISSKIQRFIQYLMKSDLPGPNYKVVSK